ncbi:MAG TPA: DoxX-like family protein [Acidobacteriota bacterium]
MSIYVEIRVRAPMDAVWAHTQTPELHESWDLRFSTIEYLPRIDDGSPQRFRYATRIGFGFEISGEGEAIGHRDSPDGSSTSALRFWSEAPLSLIREGSGYWKYIPMRGGVRFLTWYDYRTRFGVAGAVFDRVIFRPLIGWATAWSFDRLRLWLENRVDPRVAIRQTFVHLLTRVALAAVFAYQGLVPKLLARHPDEIAMMEAAGMPTTQSVAAVAALGLAELALAVTLVVAWSRTWPLWLCLVAMSIATTVVSLCSPAFFGAAFNPFSLNLSASALAAVDLLVMAGVPSAGRCLRRPVPEKP